MPLKSARNRFRTPENSLGVLALRLACCLDNRLHRLHQLVIVFLEVIELGELGKEAGALQIGLELLGVKGLLNGVGKPLFCLIRSTFRGANATEATSGNVEIAISGILQVWNGSELRNDAVSVA